MYPARLTSTTPSGRTWGPGRTKAVNRLARSVTARATSRRTSKVSAANRSRNKFERCQHGLLRATCAICLQMDEVGDLQTGRLAPEERTGQHAGDEDEGEEEE